MMIWHALGLALVALSLIWLALAAIACWVVESRESDEA